MATELKRLIQPSTISENNSSFYVWIAPYVMFDCIRHFDSECGLLDAVVWLFVSVIILDNTTAVTVYRYSLYYSINIGIAVNDLEKFSSQTDCWYIFKNIRFNMETQIESLINNSDWLKLVGVIVGIFVVIVTFGKYCTFHQYVSWVCWGYYGVLIELVFCS